jgi:hypothetical protein
MDSAHPTLEDIEALFALRSDDGVLSIYVDADPVEKRSSTPAWQIRLKNQLRALRSNSGLGADALETALSEADAAIEDAVSSGTTGRTRVLFHSREIVRSFRFGLPLRTHAEFAERAFVRPLVVALDRGAPYGVVIASKAGIRILESRLGTMADLQNYEFEDPGAPRDRRGPAAANPARGQQGVTHLERVEAHDEEQRKRFMIGRIDDVLEQAARREWVDLVLAGTAAVLDEALQARQSIPVLRLDANLGNHAEAEVGEATWQVVTDSRDARRASLVRSLIEGVDAGEPMVAGAIAASLALLEGRVAVLAFDDGLALSGRRDADGAIISLNVDATEGSREDRVIDHLIALALSTSAEVVPLDGNQADGLAEYGGVLARLRW